VRGELSPRCVILCFVIPLLVALGMRAERCAHGAVACRCLGLLFLDPPTLRRLTRLEYQGTCSSHHISPLPS
jgi:hypothetical protein